MEFHAAIVVVFLLYFLTLSLIRFDRSTKQPRAGFLTRFIPALLV